MQTWRQKAALRAHYFQPKGDDMGTLTAADRKALPKSDFGVPGEKKYPMPDKTHAANAKARAVQQAKRGKLSDAEKAKITAKADKMLGA